MLHNRAAGSIGINCTAVGAPTSGCAVLHAPLETWSIREPKYRLLDDLRAISRVHHLILVAMENDRGN
jgi:hypothetical protein